MTGEQQTGVIATRLEYLSRSAVTVHVQQVLREHALEVRRLGSAAEALAYCRLVVGPALESLETDTAGDDVMARIECDLRREALRSTRTEIQLVGRFLQDIQERRTAHWPAHSET